MTVDWRILRGSLAWRIMPPAMRERLGFTQRLDGDLFVHLPFHTKRAFVSNTQAMLRYPTFVETGTFRGDMSLHASGLFPQVHTIELDPELARRAAERFARVSNVAVHQGDSGEMLAEVLEGVKTSCVFWLDGHYSGGVTARGRTDTPIMRELAAISEHGIRPHAILIDDARVFGTDDAYPTLEEVFRVLRRIDPELAIAVSSDVIWAAPVRLLHFEWQTTPSGVVVRPSTAVFS